MVEATYFYFHPKYRRPRPRPNPIDATHFNDRLRDAYAAALLPATGATGAKVML